MPSKFVTAWKMAGGEVTPSTREIGAAFDNLMPLMLAGGAAIGPAGLAIAQGISTENDKQAPLYLARASPPGNVFPALVVPSMVAAMGQLSATFLATLTPPTPAQALAAWLTTPVGQLSSSLPPPLNVSALTLATAMSTYMSGAFIGGIGNPGDAPPPPNPPPGLPPPSVLPGFTTVLSYQEFDPPSPQRIRLGLNVAASYLVFLETGESLLMPVVPLGQPQVPFAVAWYAKDPLNGDADVTRFFLPDNLQAAPEFAANRTGLFTIGVIIANAAGSLQGERTDIFVN